MKPEMKKLIIANLPYLLFVYLFGKLGQAYRLAGVVHFKCSRKIPKNLLN